MLTPVFTIATFLLVALNLGSVMTDLAANPPVHGADFDTAYALPTALFGLALAAASFAVVRYGELVPEAP